MALYEKIDVVARHAQLFQLFFQRSQLAFGLLVVLLHPCHLAVYLTPQLLECVDGFPNVELIHRHKVQERVERHVFVLLAPVEPHRPHEELIHDVAVELHVFFEVENLVVVERGHHAHLMERRGVTLVVLNGVGVGVEHERVGEHVAGRWGAALQQVVVVGIHTGDHIVAQVLAQTVHHRLLLAAREVGARRKHHLKLQVVAFEVVEHTAPEEDVGVAFHVCHDLLLTFALRVQLAGCLYEFGVQVSCQSFAHRIPVLLRVLKLI